MRDVTYEKLVTVLLKLGFEKRATVGDHQYLEHDPTRTIVVLPPATPRQEVPPATLASVRMSIIGRNVAAQSEIDKLLFDNGHLQSASARAS